MGELPSGLLFLLVPCWCWRSGWPTGCPCASAVADSLEHSDCRGGSVLAPWTGGPVVKVVRIQVELALDATALAVGVVARGRVWATAGCTGFSGAEAASNP